MILLIDDGDEDDNNQSRRTNADRDTNQAGVPLSIIWSFGAPPTGANTVPADPNADFIQHLMSHVPNELETLQPLVDPTIPAREDRQE